MPNNTLPSGISPLISLAESMADGYEAHAVWMRIAADADEFRPFVTRLHESEGIFQEAKVQKAFACEAAAAADEALTEWLVKARVIVALALGAKWSMQWVGAGFTHRRTNIPKRIELRIALAERLVEFFGRNAQFEVAFAGVTAVNGEAIYSAITDARQQMRRATGECIRCKRTRDEAERRLRRKMRSVILMLSAVLTVDDSRWLAFGLNQPRRGRRRSRFSRVSETAVAPIVALPAQAAAPVETVQPAVA